MRQERAGGVLVEGLREADRGIGSGAVEVGDGEPLLAGERVALAERAAAPAGEEVAQARLAGAAARDAVGIRGGEEGRQRRFPPVAGTRLAGSLCT